MSFYRPEWGNDGITESIGSLKRKFRWFFNIQNITSNHVTALPCVKAARPKLNFKEMQAEHVNETIYFPGKPEWQPIQITLYDRCIASQNPIFTWLKTQYDPSPVGCGNWYPCLGYNSSDVAQTSFKVACSSLSLLDGCGNVIEAWQFENAYPQNIDWGDLDMDDAGIVAVSFSLRYDRAYQSFPEGNHILYGSDPCTLGCFEPGCTQPVGGSSSNTDNNNNNPVSPGAGSSTGEDLPAGTFDPITDTFPNIKKTTSSTTSPGVFNPNTNITPNANFAPVIREPDFILL